MNEESKRSKIIKPQYLLTYLGYIIQDRLQNISIVIQTNILKY